MPIIVDGGGTPGFTLDLCALWLNDAADLADNVAFAYVTSMTPNREQPGDVRMLAGGRERLVTTAGSPRTYGWKMSRVDRAQIGWLEDHVGRVVCVRDERGRKFYGTYLSSPIDEANWSKTRGAVDLSLRSVTHTEAV